MERVGQDNLDTTNALMENANFCGMTVAQDIKQTQTPQSHNTHDSTLNTRKTAITTAQQQYFELLQKNDRNNANNEINNIIYELQNTDGLTPEEQNQLHTHAAQILVKILLEDQQEATIDNIIAKANSLSKTQLKNNISDENTLTAKIFYELQNSMSNMSTVDIEKITTCFNILSILHNNLSCMIKTEYALSAIAPNVIKQFIQSDDNETSQKHIQELQTVCNDIRNPTVQCTIRNHINDAHQFLTNKKLATEFTNAIYTQLQPNQLETAKQNINGLICIVPPDPKDPYYDAMQSHVAKQLINIITAAKTACTESQITPAQMKDFITDVIARANNHPNTNDKNTLIQAMIDVAQSKLDNMQAFAYRTIKTCLEVLADIHKYTIDPRLSEKSTDAATKAIDTVLDKFVTREDIDEKIAKERQNELVEISDNFRDKAFVDIMAQKINRHNLQKGTEQRIRTLTTNILKQLKNPKTENITNDLDALINLAPNNISDEISQQNNNNVAKSLVQILLSAHKNGQNDTIASIITKICSKSNQQAKSSESINQASSGSTIQTLLACVIKELPSTYDNNTISQQEYVSLLCQIYDPLLKDNELASSISILIEGQVSTISANINSNININETLQYVDMLNMIYDSLSITTDKSSEILKNISTTLASPANTILTQIHECLMPLNQNIVQGDINVIKKCFAILLKVSPKLHAIDDENMTNALLSSCNRIATRLNNLAMKDMNEEQATAILDFIRSMYNFSQTTQVQLSTQQLQKAASNLINKLIDSYISDSNTLIIATANHNLFKNENFKDTLTTALNNKITEVCHNIQRNKDRDSNLQKLKKLHNLIDELKRHNHRIDGLNTTQQLQEVIDVFLSEITTEDILSRLNLINKIIKLDTTNTLHTYLNQQINDDVNNAHRGNILNAIDATIQNNPNKIEQLTQHSIFDKTHKELFKKYADAEKAEKQNKETAEMISQKKQDINNIINNHLSQDITSYNVKLIITEARKIFDNQAISDDIKKELKQYFNENFTQKLKEIITQMCNGINSTNAISTIKNIQKIIDATNDQSTSFWQKTDSFSDIRKTLQEHFNTAITDKLQEIITQMCNGINSTNAISTIKNIQKIIDATNDQSKSVRKKIDSFPDIRKTLQEHFNTAIKGELQKIVNDFVSPNLTHECIETVIGITNLNNNISNIIIQHINYYIDSIFKTNAKIGAKTFVNLAELIDNLDKTQAANEVISNINTKLKNYIDGLINNIKNDTFNSPYNIKELNTILFSRELKELGQNCKLNLEKPIKNFTDETKQRIKEFCSKISDSSADDFLTRANAIFTLATSLNSGYGFTQAYNQAMHARLQIIIKNKLSNLTKDGQQQKLTQTLEDIIKFIAYSNLPSDKMSDLLKLFQNNFSTTLTNINLPTNTDIKELFTQIDSKITGLKADNNITSPINDTFKTIKNLIAIKQYQNICKDITEAKYSENFSQAFQNLVFLETKIDSKQLNELHECVVNAIKTYASSLITDKTNTNDLSTAIERAQFIRIAFAQRNAQNEETQSQLGQYLKDKTDTIFSDFLQNLNKNLSSSQNNVDSGMTLKILKQIGHFTADIAKMNQERHPQELTGVRSLVITHTLNILPQASSKEEINAIFWFFYQQDQAFGKKKCDINQSAFENCLTNLFTGLNNPQQQQELYLYAIHQMITLMMPAKKSTSKHSGHNYNNLYLFSANDNKEAAKTLFDLICKELNQNSTSFTQDMLQKATMLYQSSNVSHDKFKTVCDIHNLLTEDNNAHKAAIYCARRYDIQPQFDDNKDSSNNNLVNNIFNLQPTTNTNIERHTSPLNFRKNRTKILFKYTKSQPKKLEIHITRTLFGIEFDITNWYKNQHAGKISFSESNRQPRSTTSTKNITPTDNGNADADKKPNRKEETGTMHAQNQPPQTTHDGDVDLKHWQKKANDYSNHNLHKTNINEKSKKTDDNDVDFSKVKNE